MNSPIKFRAWDKLNEEWIEIRFLGFEDGGDLWYVEDYHGEVYFEDSDDWVLLQYIGLKDSNGVDICEGDILIRHRNVFDVDDGYDLLAVKRHAFGFGVYLISDGKVTNNHFYWSVYQAQKVDAVIGNIYKDKHLMEGY